MDIIGYPGGYLSYVMIMLRLKTLTATPEKKENYINVNISLCILD